jgi:hypothetical protein
VSETGFTVTLATLLVLGLSAVAFGWRRVGKLSRFLHRAGAVVLVLSLLGFLSLCSQVYADGGYPQVEFRLTFEGPTGTPVEGVELRVEDEEGHNFFSYPITDYLPSQVPISDRRGLMVFHHVSRGIEFTHHAHNCWGLFWVDVTRGPRFICRFVHRGQEVYRTSFHDLNDTVKRWSEAEIVKRRWHRSAWPLFELLSQGASWEEAAGRARQLFCFQANGKLGPEGSAAFSASLDFKNEEAAAARLQGREPEEEIEFSVMRKTVTIRPQGH